MLIRIFAISFFINSVFAKPLQLEDGDVIAFIGGTDLVRIQKEGKLEAAITHRFGILTLILEIWHGKEIRFIFKARFVRDGGKTLLVI